YIQCYARNLTSANYRRRTYLSFFTTSPLLPHDVTLFPDTTLFRALRPVRAVRTADLRDPRRRCAPGCDRAADPHAPGLPWGGAADRKSTRLNSSHVSGSYAVFRLQRKTTSITLRRIRYLS